MKGKRMEDLLPKEIMSHASALTNLRIDNILKNIDEWKAICWMRQDMTSVEAYFAFLFTLYDNIYPVLDEKDDEKMENLIKKYLSLYFSMKGDESKWTVKNTFRLILLCDQMNQIMRGSLQKRGYFFRMTESERGGLAKKLEIISQGGGIFAGVQKVAPDEHKPEPDER